MSNEEFISIAQIQRFTQMKNVNKREAKATGLISNNSIRLLARLFTLQLAIFVNLVENGVTTIYDEDVLDNGSTLFRLIFKLKILALVLFGNNFLKSITLKTDKNSGFCVVY